MRRRFVRLLRRRYLTTQKRLRDAAIRMQQPLRFLRAFWIGGQIRFIIAVMFGVIALGTSGYLMLGWSLVDALYMTLITITTIGFGEIRPLDDVGRLFTMALILSSVGLITYGLSSAVEYVVTGQLLASVEERERSSMIKGLQKHFIVAGFGRVGQEVALALKEEGVRFVVVDSAAEAIDRARTFGYLVVHGSASEDDVLEEAGIRRANGIICAAGQDATNVYIALSARGLNGNLFIIARASDDRSEAKLLRAGADRVISPYTLSGRRMANLAVRPYVVNFLDVTGSAGELEKTLEEIVVEEGAILSNRTLGEIDLRQRTGALILGLFRVTGELLTSPSSETLLEPGTRMIVLGTRDELDVTEALARNFMTLSEGEDYVSIILP